jgi:hypothetical protein
MSRTVDQERASVPLRRLVRVRDELSLFEIEIVQTLIAIQMLNGKGSVFATTGL